MVAKRGYRWFYLDALSDDGKSALVVIGLLGSPFSPAFARARARQHDVDPLAFSAFNVCLQHGRQSHWALTERSAHRVARDRSSLAIGASSMRWEHEELVIDVNERTSPWRRPLRGRAVLRPTIRGAPEAIAIDGSGAHVWRPIVPLGRIEVQFEEPSCSFRGTGYLDTNSGDEPLEDAFSSWSWTRLALEDGARITYDARMRDGRSLRHGVVADARGTSPFVGGVERRLDRTRFGLERSMRVAEDDRPSLLRTLEDGPFYARSAVEVACADGNVIRGVHEAISLTRLKSRLVQFLIPFRASRET